MNNFCCLIHYVLFAALLFGSSNVSFAQNDFREQFESFKKSNEDSYKSFRDSANVEFAKCLRMQWESFHLMDGNPRPERDEPEVEFSSEKEYNVSMEYQKDIDDVETIIVRKLTTELFSTGKQMTTSSNNVFRNVSLRFYGNNLKIPVPADYGSFHPDGISERAVGDFWEKLSSYDCYAMDKAVAGFSGKLSLNDWGKLMLAKKISASIFTSDINSECVIFAVYLLNRLGLSCRIARSGRTLLCLFESSQPVFARKFIDVEGRRFYTDSDIGDVMRLSTYRFEASNKYRPLDLNITTPLRFDTPASVYTVSRYSTVFGRDISVQLDANALAFYDDYPQVDMKVYSSETPTEVFYSSLLGQLKPLFAGKADEDALNLLLSFFHKDFSYKTDLEQFGYEKPFFIEDNFRYKYNDCEDRAVLMCFLVKELLGLDCLLLDYPNHVECAVCLDKSVAGCYVSRGASRYYVCDPTYIGAKVGMSCIPSNVKPKKVWVL